MEKKSELIERLTSEANSAKRELMRICDRMKEVSPRKANSLDTIIGKLEDWQHKK